MESNERKPGTKADEAAEIARLIEELESVGQKSARPRAVFPNPAPLRPIPQVAIATRHPIGTIGLQKSRALDWMRRLRTGSVSGPMGRTAVWTCVCLGVALGISMLYWPYGRSCGSGLACYLGAVGMVHVAGVWAAWHAWDSRVGVAHVMALATVLWACSLTAWEVLPRVGYAKTPASWSCSVGSTSQG